MRQYCDSHVHTRNSHDGKLPIADIVEIAKSKGLCYLCTTDHLDYDLEYGNNKSPIKWKFLDLDKYAEEWKVAKQALDEDKNSTLNLRFGIEAAYSGEKEVCDRYRAAIEKYRFDTVINSVHCVDGKETYFKNAFLFKSKKKAYSRYIQTVLESLDAPYHYDTVAHFGYITHGAPYFDKTFRYEDFPDEIDAVLKGVIERNKALEINFHHQMNPPRDVIQRYYDLGGRKISYGSDAHRGDICKEYDATCDLLSEIGFTHFSVFEFGGKETLIPIN